MKSLSQARLIHSIDISRPCLVAAMPDPSIAACSSQAACAATRRQDAAAIIAPTSRRSRLRRPGVADRARSGFAASPGRALSGAERDERCIVRGGIAIRNWFAVGITTGLALLGLFLLDQFRRVGRRPLLARTGSYTSQLGISADEYGAWRILLIAIALWPAACAWAFWFARERLHSLEPDRAGRSACSSCCDLDFVLALVWPGNRDGWHGLLRLTILAVSLASVVTYCLAEFEAFRRDGASVVTRNCVDALAQEDRVRTLLAGGCCAERWCWSARPFLTSFTASPAPGCGTISAAWKRQLGTRERDGGAWTALA